VKLHKTQVAAEAAVEQGQ